MTQVQVEKSRQEDEEYDATVALAIVEFMKRQQHDWIAIKRNAESARAAAKSRQGA